MVVGRPSSSSATRAAVSMRCLPGERGSADVLDRPACRLDRLACRLDCRLDGLRHGGLREDLVMRIFAAHRMLEVAQSSPQRPPYFRKPLRAEYQQRDHEDEQEMGRLEDVANHEAKA